MLPMIPTDRLLRQKVEPSDFDVNSISFFDVLPMQQVSRDDLHSAKFGITMLPIATI